MRSLIIPNDRLLATVSKETTLKAAFAMSDDILKQAVEGISDLITQSGIINVDFADVRAVMENSGSHSWALVSPLAKTALRLLQMPQFQAHFSRSRSTALRASSLLSPAAKTSAW
jgi:cell division GTPase FtsZ